MNGLRMIYVVVLRALVRKGRQACGKLYGLEWFWMTLTRIGLANSGIVDEVLL